MSKPFSRTAVRLGKAIRRLRKRAELSQEELAASAGIHRTYIGSVERGERNISLDNLERIARALKVTLPGLFEEAEQ